MMDTSGDTAAHLAARGAHLEALAELLRVGPLVNASAPKAYLILCSSLLKLQQHTD